MLFHLFFLLLGCFCYSSNEMPTWTVLQNTVAMLPCPHEKGDVTWSRYIGGALVTLVTIKNGLEAMDDKRYGSLADNSLVIRNVTSFDDTMYFCNKRKVYLIVTTDPNMVDPNAGKVPVTPTNDGRGPGLGSGLGSGLGPGLGSGLGPGQKGIAGDAESRAPSGLWKVLVGVGAGAALVLLLAFTLKFCLKNRTEKTTNSDNTATEVIYEEIEAGESHFESPFYFPSASETASTSTPPNNNLYSTVNKLSAEGRSSESVCIPSLKIQ